MLESRMQAGQAFCESGPPCVSDRRSFFFSLAPRCGEENESRQARCHLAFCLTYLNLGGSPDHTIRRRWERVKSRQTSSDSAKVKTTCEDRLLPLATWLRSANRTASRGTTVNRVKLHDRADLLVDYGIQSTTVITQLTGPWKNYVISVFTLHRYNVIFAKTLKIA